MFKKPVQRKKYPSAVEPTHSRLRSSLKQAAQEFDGVYHPVPRFAPFVAAGYYVAHSGILKDAPYDPFLPYIFMGEEIIMSSRYWTHGYDIFAPAYSVVGHIYERKHKPKFWETIDRLFEVEGINDDLGLVALERVKHQLQYIESSRDYIKEKTVLHGLEHYTMGTERSIWDYLDMAGIDPIHKVINKQNVAWCVLGVPPPFYGKNFTKLYPKGDPSQLDILKENYIDDDGEQTAPLGEEEIEDLKEAVEEELEEGEDAEAEAEDTEEEMEEIEDIEEDDAADEEEGAEEEGEEEEEAEDNGADPWEGDSQDNEEEEEDTDDET